MNTIKSEIFKLKQSQKALKNLVSDFGQYDGPLWVKKVWAAIFGIEESIKELNSIVNSGVEQPL